MYGCLCTNVCTLPLLNEYTANKHVDMLRPAKELPGVLLLLGRQQYLQHLQCIHSAVAAATRLGAGGHGTGTYVSKRVDICHRISQSVIFLG